MPKPPDMSALADLRQQVPDHIRQEIRNVLLSANVGGYDAFNELCIRIMAELFAGNISPEVATAAKGYAELLFTSLAAKQIQEAKQDQPATLAEALAEASRKAKKIKPSFTLEDHGDGSYSMDAELTPAPVYMEDE